MNAEAVIASIGPLRPRGRAEWHVVPPGGVVVVEGVSAMKRELGAYWDLAVWVECPAATRLARGIARDGESMRRQWVEVWMPWEDAYVRDEQPRERADLVVDGGGAARDG